MYFCFIKCSMLMCVFFQLEDSWSVLMMYVFIIRLTFCRAAQLHRNSNNKVKDCTDFCDMHPWNFIQHLVVPLIWALLTDCTNILVMIRQWAVIEGNLVPSAARMHTRLVITHTHHTHTHTHTHHIYTHTDTHEHVQSRAQCSQDAHQTSNHKHTRHTHTTYTHTHTYTHTTPHT